METLVKNQIQTRQIQQIQTICAARFADRDERLDYISAFFKREITSSKELTFFEADDLIYFLNTGQKSNANWAFFYKDKFVAERQKLFSLLHQAQWTQPHKKYGTVADLERLSNFLKSPKSPVNKPLKQFTKTDWNKINAAFTGIIKSKYK